MIGAIMGGAQALAGIAKGIIANSQHKKYAKLLESQELNMPTGISAAEGYMTDMAGQGLSGLDLMKSSLDSNMASTITSAKKIASSPAELMNALISSDQNRQIGTKDLMIQDAQERSRNKLALASFLGSVKAPAEMRINQFDIDKTLGAQRERMAGVNELMQGIEGGLGAGMGSFGMGKKLDYMGDRNEAMKKYWQMGGTNPGAGIGGGDFATGGITV